MPVQFENYTHSFELNGKPVFAPNDLGRKIGGDVKRRVEEAYVFEPFYFHLGPGGHVSAIHAHRENEFFCKVDIDNFFYSISRNRVVRTLREVGIERPKHYGKWSCVKNPYEQPRYSIPYGFVQSPILATLVLSTSAVGNFLRQLPSTITKAVYVDDITLSSNDRDALRNCYDSLLGVMEGASLLPKATKCLAPTTQLKVFNCSLETSQTVVLPERREEFFRVPRSPDSIDGFVRYCDRVELGNK